MNRHISRKLKWKVLEYREVAATTGRRQLYGLHIINADYRYGQNNWIRIIVVERSRMKDLREEVGTNIRIVSFK